ncbi:hypothetical protein TSUD_49820 [Trifolium subterraneum]|uniref:Serine aminopeptidase S33 domain-containing protein n=1 Tax=Trifolium subterraneum TaxID=3900 RepID=A0A2Z6MPZ2_TRISU|nr:hypothetical protein TSUD_49820 [Trifolium subterraneum]
MGIIQYDPIYSLCKVSSTFRRFPRATIPFRLKAFSTAVHDKPSICTADELHYVSVSNSDWKLALWRYHPSPQAPPRNHPLLLLSGVGTNAVGYDLSPKSSFARHMSGQGFETWILEVRGAGLSVQGSNSKDIEQSANAMSEKMEDVLENATNEPMSSKKELDNIAGAVSGPYNSASEGVETENVAAIGDLTRLATAWDESMLVARLSETFTSLSERVSGFLGESQAKVMSAKLLDQFSKLLADSPLYEQFNEVRGKLATLLETRQNSGITSQITELSEKLVDIFEAGQLSVSPPLFDLQARFTSTLEDFQKQLDLIAKYNWDFDHYLEEDVPAAIEYILKQSMPKDGKLLAIGHSMGGILLYSMLSRSDPAKSLPFVPLGAMLVAAYEVSSRSPYASSWLNTLISAEGMMDPDLFKRLVLNNFWKLLLDMLVSEPLCLVDINKWLNWPVHRDGTFFYKDHLHKSNVPILAIAGDKDLICPPEAVEDTVKLIPEHLVTYKLFGDPEGPHYAHYDLVGGRLAVEQEYPCIVEFLSCHDKCEFLVAFCTLPKISYAALT